VVMQKIHMYQHQYDFCKPYLKKFNTALDIGCDYLEWSIVLTKDFQAVKSFDFKPKNIDLKKYPKIELFVVGLAEVETTRYTKPGVGRIKAKENPVGTSTMPVKLKTLDSFAFGNVDFIKIDCDGYEEKILQGGADTIAKNSPAIFCEYNPTRCDSHNWLLKHDYKLVDTYYLDGQPHDGLYIKN